MFYTPTPNEIKDARLSSNLTQEACAKMCLLTTNTWSRYEQGRVQMPPPIWELFILKVAQLSLEAKPVASKAVDPNITTPEEKAFFDEMMSDWRTPEQIEAAQWGYPEGHPLHHTNAKPRG